MSRSRHDRRRQRPARDRRAIRWLATVRGISPCEAGRIFDTLDEVGKREARESGAAVPDWQWPSLRRGGSCVARERR